MVRKIIGVKSPQLRKRSKPVKKVDKKVLSLIQDLKDTLAIQEEPEGVGLAAPQIGRAQRVFVAKFDEKIRAFINPKILFLSKGKSKKKRKSNGRAKVKRIMEGCLSLPNFYGPLRRLSKIKINYLDEKGRRVTESFEGFKAQIIQHEIDHLNGVIFVDRLLEQKKPLYELVEGEWEEVELV